MLQRDVKGVIIQGFAPDSIKQISGGVGFDVTKILAIQCSGGGEFEYYIGSDSGNKAKHIGPLLINRKVQEITITAAATFEIMSR